jgi:hypothetical protein
MLALRVRCVHPRTLRAYIKSSVGGKENSKEGLQVSYRPQLSSLFIDAISPFSSSNNL